MGQAIDWDIARSVGSRVAGGGPDLAPEIARTVVEHLYELAEQALPLVQRTARLPVGLDSEVRVVDRRQWVASNISGFQVVSRPLTDRLEQSSGLVTTVGGTLTGAQLGAVLGFVGSKVLGQFEIFTGPGQMPRLLLVAPNIVEIEQKLEVVPRDFRLWVAVHEQTHRIQFAAAPWLADHLLSEVHRYMRLSEVSFSDVVARLRAAAGVASGRSPDDDGLIGALQTPQQREIFDRLTALMSLLEGHADVIMDEVGPEHIPSVVYIRAAFQDHRADAATGWEGLLRKLLGLDLKAKQYAQGADFVRAVMADRGLEGLNRVWDSPEFLPSRAEIEDPQLWIDRV